jgi:CRP-like cAMP-binding protein
MLDPENTPRALSAITKTDCILLKLNNEAFELLVKEKLKKDREDLGRFVYNSFPKIK